MKQYGNYIEAGTGSGVPITPDLCFSTDLINGALSKSMVVDGVIPVEYTYSVPIGKQLNLIGLGMFIFDGSNFGYDTFAGITALINGLSFNLKNNEIAILKDNLDISTFFNIESHSGLAAINRHFICKKDFVNPVILQSGETVKVIVQDDLTALSELEVKIFGLLENVK